MRREERLGTAAVLVSALGYGFLGILVKLGLAAGTGPLPLATWRFLLGAAFVWLFLALRRSSAPAFRAWPRLAGLGLLYALNALTYIVALQWVPASTATLVFYAYPVVVVLLAALLLGERFTRRRAGAVALAAAGCVMTAGLGAAGAHPLGIGLVLLSMASLSVYIVAGRSLLPTLPGHGSAAVIISATALAILAIALASGRVLPGGGAPAWRILALLALVSTALPITLFVMGLKRVDAGKAAIYSTIEPIVTVVAAGLLLDERIAPLQYFGGTLILAGVLWLRLERPPRPEPRLDPLEAP